MTDDSYTLGFVLASEYRKKVMITLQDKASTPSIISEKIKIYPSHISNTLSELVEKKLVVCITPKLRKGRLYELTTKGQEIIKSISTQFYSKNDQF
jgi:predicted transcriptional regulator